MREYDKLDLIENLILKGTLESALSQIQEEEKKELNIEKQLKLQFLKSKALLKLGKYKKAQEIASHAYKTAEEKGQNLILIDLVLILTESYWRTGRYKEGLDTIKSGEKINVIIKDTSPVELVKREAEINFQKGMINWIQGYYTEALEFMDKCLTIRLSLGLKNEIARSHNSLGSIYTDVGQYDNALRHFKMSLKIGKDIDDKKLEAYTLCAIGRINHYQRRLDDALDYYWQSFRFFTELKDKYFLGRVHSKIGNVLFEQGDLSESLNHYLRSLVHKEDIRDKKGIALALFDIARISAIRGDLLTAIGQYQRILMIFRELGDNKQISLIMGRIAELYHQKGEYEKKNLNTAKTEYEKALAFAQGIGYKDYIIPFYNMIKIALLLEDEDQAKLYFDQLKENSRRIKKPITEYVLSLSTILMEIMIFNNETTEELKEDLLDLIDEDNENSSLEIDSMLLYLRVLLGTIDKTEDNEGIIPECIALSSKLVLLVEKKFNYPLIVELQLLKSKLVALEMDIKRSQQILVQALSVAEQNDYHELANSILGKHDILIDRLMKWDKFISREANMSEVVEFLKVIELIDKILFLRMNPMQEEISHFSEKTRGLLETWDKN